MPPELRLLAWKSWRDLKPRFTWGLLALAALTCLGVGARAVLMEEPRGVWAEMERRMAARGVRAADLPAYLRLWWHEGGIRPGLMALGALLGAAGPGLDRGRGSGLLLASLPVPRSLPPAIHAAVASGATVAASAWVALLAVLATAPTGAPYPIGEAAGMSAAGALLALPATGLGVLAAVLVRRRVPAVLLALLGLWALATAAPLLGPWSPWPSPTYAAWRTAAAPLPALVLTSVLLALSLARAARAQP